MQEEEKKSPENTKLSKRTKNKHGRVDFSCFGKKAFYRIVSFILI